MKTNTAHLFRRLKQLLRKAEIIQNRQAVTKELRYVERSCLITNSLARETVRTLGRIAKLVKRHQTMRPELFFKEFLQIHSTLEEYNEAARKHAERIKRGN